MEKIPISLIVLMIISLGFITGCTQQNGTSNNNKENALESNEFINWTTDTVSEMTTQFEQIKNTWESNLDDCLTNIRQAKRNIDIYINQSKNFSLKGSLYSARFWFIEFLTTYKQFYEQWDLAVQAYIAGNTAAGNYYANEGLEIKEEAQTYLAKSAQDISWWQTQNEG